MCFQALRWPQGDVKKNRDVDGSWKVLCLDKHSSLLDLNLMKLNPLKGELLRPYEEMASGADL
jgi:hypothetical protein